MKRIWFPGVTIVSTLDSSIKVPTERLFWGGGIRSLPCLLPLKHSQLYLRPQPGWKLHPQLGGNLADDIKLPMAANGIEDRNYIRNDGDE